VQLDPVKPTLKAPGTMPLTLKYDKLPSNSAFNFDLRRYTKVVELGLGLVDIACHVINSYVFALVP